MSETSLNMRNKEKVEGWRRKSNDYERKVFFEVKNEFLGIWVLKVTILSTRTKNKVIITHLFTFFFLTFLYCQIIACFNYFWYFLDTVIYESSA